MGGGDLNLKKSWHPNTLKNQKRVYEAEQADAAEKRKLHELQREIQHERNFEELKKIGQSSGVLAADDSKRLEWMYKGAENSLNREQYLTGRSIDKHFEEQEKADRQRDAANLIGVTVPKNHVEHECLPFSIRAFKGAPDNKEQVDLQRKLMEDPLMLIQQREMEARQKLLQNPVKLKEIHRLLQADKNLKESPHRKKKSKNKRSSSNSDESDDLDSQLAKKYKKLVGDKGSKSGAASIDKLLNEKYEKLSSELDKIKKLKKGDKVDKKKKSKKKKRESSSSRNSSSSSRSRSSNDSSLSRAEGTRKRMAKGRGRRESSINRPDRIVEKRFKENLPQRNRFNRRSWSPVRDNRWRENNSRYNKNGRNRDRFENSRRRSTPRRHSNSRRRSTSRGQSNFRRRSNSRHRSPYQNNKYRQPERKNRSRSPVQRKRDFSVDRYRNRKDDRDNNRNRSIRVKGIQSNKSKSLSPLQKQQRHSRSRSRSRSYSNKHRTLNSKLEVRARSKTPENRKQFQRNVSNDDEQQIERAVRTAALPPRHSSSSSSGSSSDSDSDSDSDHGKEATKNFGLVTADGEKIELKKTTKYTPVIAQKKPTSTYVPPSQPRKTLTEEEKEARLCEMQQNAKWHNKQLNMNRMRNEERLKRETEEEKNVEFDRNYIHKEMHKALTNQDSVEARLKSNKNNIQRMSSSMHSHFARK